jgi:hypothetical protein
MEPEVRAFAYGAEGMGKVPAYLGRWDGPCAEVGGTGSLWMGRGSELECGRHTWTVWVIDVDALPSA